MEQWLPHCQTRQETTNARAISPCYGGNVRRKVSWFPVTCRGWTGGSLHWPVMWNLWWTAEFEGDIPCGNRDVKKESVIYCFVLWVLGGWRDFANLFGGMCHVGEGCHNFKDFLSRELHYWIVWMLLGEERRETTLTCSGEFDKSQIVMCWGTLRQPIFRYAISRKILYGVNCCNKFQTLLGNFVMLV